MLVPPAVDVSRLTPPGGGEDSNACHQKLTLTDPGRYFIYVSLTP